MSLFKKKSESSDSVQDQLAKISDQLVFLEKKIDQLLESRQGGGRRFGGPNRGFNQNRGGGNFRHQGQNGNRHENGNTHFAGQGPTRYSSGGGRSYGNHRGPGGNRQNHRPHRRPNNQPRPQEFQSGGNSQAENTESSASVSND